MFIKSIVIDGFKSYAVRTEITGFDESFNAITGLNGSGKSNILDAICFLLGIVNMSQIRAANLQELVYKSGQAGVTKATVSITFDNKDKDSSPVGYEQFSEITVCRQVVLGGRNKYTINGSNANNVRVQDLFRSVQLNVNNPHFLIMQGRITKVLNMKPPEILSMIEEAAGTKLYESKKESALKTIEKKNGKLAEIDDILKEEIEPKLNQLKEERASYLTYQKIIRELEHLNKMYIAYKFVCAEEAKTRCSEDVGEMQQEINLLNERITQTADKIEELNEYINNLEKQRDQESGSVLAELEDVLKSREKDDAKCQSVVDSKKQAVTAEKRSLKDINKNITDDKKVLSNKEREVQQLSSNWETIQSESKADQDSHTEAQRHYQAVSAGLSSNTDGDDASLNDQLMAAKSEISRAETEVKQTQMRLKHDESELKKRESSLRQTEQQYQKEQAACNSLKANISKIQADMAKLKYEDGQEERLVADHRAATREMEQLRETTGVLESRYPQLSFDYTSPEPSFDRKKVHGLVAKLVDVKNPEMATALEVAAGGKLFNVIVDNEMTGKKLLQKGNLTRRYTIIPLNKISARSIDPAIVKKAQDLVGKENVFTALSLVNYDTKLQKAMEFVFGSTFVCRGMDAAKSVAFNPAIMKRCVTLEGDVFDPSGTLTGGSRQQTNAILLKVKELLEVEAKYTRKETEIKKLDQDVRALTAVAKKYRELKETLDLRTHEASLMKTNLDQGAHQQELNEITQLKSSINEQRDTAKAAADSQQRMLSKVKDLENKIKNAGALREKELKEAELHVKDCKKKMEASDQAMKKAQQEMDGLRLECDEITKAISSYNDQVKIIEETLAKFDEEMKELQESVAQTQMRVKEAKEDLNKQKDLLKTRNKDIGIKVTEKKTLQDDCKKAKLLIQETNLKIGKMKKEAQDSSRQVEEMLKAYQWIVDEKKYFGQPNSVYDFTANDAVTAGKRIKELEDNKNKLEKNVNMRAMNMLGSAEEQFEDLKKKRRIVQHDKETIETTIKELDEKKKEVLKNAWIQINKDFGSIFSILLPGTQAKLDQPDGDTELTGLEVKVAFGDVWKESLSELSGGQRSLVALSLILSMLLFKPAPIYILDEVDAALDLSHTQNIGLMIKTHFTQSQFIVVSLKDGMFNNANVLFKTKFVDGVSTVTRHVQNSLKTPNSASNTTENIPREKQKKK